MADISALITQESLRLSEQLTVPTRIYFPSGTVPIESSTNPAFDAAWNTTGAAVRRKPVVDGRKKGTAAASVTVTSAATNPEKILLAQYVSQPLRAQTIAGNIRGQFRALESNAAFNGTLQIGIRVVSADGSTVRGTVLTVGGTVTTATTPPEFTTSLTNRRLLTSGDVTPLPLSSVVCLEGDRLVIEIGVNDKDSGTARTAQISFGDNTVDLTTDDTATAAQDPWIEFDTIIQFQNAVENVHVVDSGTTQLMNQGWIKANDRDEIAAALDRGTALFHAENLRISESATMVVDLGAIVSTENLKIADGPPTGSRLDQGLTVSGIDEALHVVDTVLPTLNPLETSKSEALSVVDGPATYLPIWMVTAGPESLKVVDAGGGLTSLIGVLHIQDTVSAAIVSGNDLAVTLNPGESLHVVDTVTVSRGLTATLAEALSVVDTLTVSRELTASLAEALSIVDSVTTLEDPEQATPTESLKIAESLTVEVNTSINATPADDVVRVVDQTPVGRLDPIQQQVADEVLHIQDAAAGAPTPIFATAGPDSLKITDAVTVQFSLVPSPAPAESLKVSDALTVSVDWSAAVADDSLRLADGPPLATTQTLQVQVASEGLKLSDRVVILQALLNESLRLIDSGFGSTQLLGTLHIQDTIQAQLGNILNASPSELLHVQDLLSQPERTPYEVTATEVVKLAYIFSEVEYTQDEYAKVSDVVAADLAAPGTLSTSLSDELLKLSDVAVMNRDLECPVTQEVGKIADSLTMSRGIEATAAEGLTPVDSVTVSRDLTTTPTEDGRLADTALGTVDPEQGVTSDTGRLADVVAVNLGNPFDLSVGMGNETLILVETLTTARGLTATLSEAVSLSESLNYGDGTLLTVSVAEALRISEFRDTGTDLRAGLDQEDFPLSDQVFATLAIPSTVGQESAQMADSFLQVAMDLATDTTPPPPDNIPPADPGDTWRTKRRAKITWRSAKAKTTWRSIRKRL